MRLLLIEDDEKIAAFVKKGFKEAGFVVEHASDGNTGLSMALASSYDVAVIDIMLPGLDGLSIIDDLRRHRNKLPVIILSAKRSLDERVEGLQAGGDDYLTKPFAFTELLVRVQALIRRASNIPEPTGLTVGDLSIDLLRRTVTRAGKKIDLQPREFSLIEYLARNSGRVVSKTMIMEDDNLVRGCFCLVIHSYLCCCFYADCHYRESTYG
ncbi:MAG: DNA-binding response regulator [gamma proteobacterium symbiont of Ctena orbiculata]|nr:response regulator transcription factor [Candidatus Thiodiazotropha taylori]PVV10301.1 MAG: DNA-binding response regulator [gamma proteobacterium symbiont of Ctena orbiculata]MBT2997469.1 response regulator transcription factor [Candidatus Thiodiazotropha taylori]MBT3001143.1 response regulator transcription factor [Candidatus Thiodiazotropha taylori]MBT3027634.1 response regulator transcription factor [Candidatus Thiodiazotropha taylori]